MKSWKTVVQNFQKMTRRTRPHQQRNKRRLIYLSQSTDLKPDIFGVTCSRRWTGDSLTIWFWWIAKCFCKKEQENIGRRIKMQFIKVMVWGVQTYATRNVLFLILIGQNVSILVLALYVSVLRKSVLSLLRRRRSVWRRLCRTSMKSVSRVSALTVGGEISFLSLSYQLIIY